MIVTVLAGGEVTATHRPSGDASRLCGPAATRTRPIRRHGGPSSTATVPARSAATNARYAGRFVADAADERVALAPGAEPPCTPRVDGLGCAAPPHEVSASTAARQAMRQGRMTSSVGVMGRAHANYMK
jgi:hypothetical protein